MALGQIYLVGISGRGLSQKNGSSPLSLYVELGGFRARIFLINGIWILGILSKVAFFMWTVFNG